MSDLRSVLETVGLSSAGVAAVILMFKVIQTVNNKKCRSSCCGRSAEVAVAVNELTEEEKKSPVLTVVSSRKETPVPPLSLAEPKGEEK